MVSEAFSFKINRFRDFSAESIHAPPAAPIILPLFSKGARVAAGLIGEKGGVELPVR